MKNYQELITDEPENQVVKEIKEQIILVLNGKKYKKEVLEEFKGKGNLPQDIKTLNACIETAAINDEQIREAYNKYKKRAAKSDYLKPICYMLSNDLSIHEAAEYFSISRDTLKGAVKRAEELDPELKNIIIEHNQRHSIGKYCQKMSEEESEKVGKKLVEIVKKIIAQQNNEKCYAPSTERRDKARAARAAQLYR